MAKKKTTRAMSAASCASPRVISKLPKLPSRETDAHKGDFGRVLVIGGSRGMIGAPALTANAALRVGAGLVTIACPESIYQSVAVLCPCATTIPLPETPKGQLDPVRALKVIDEARSFGAPARPSVVAAGPGLGRGNVRFDQSWRSLIHAFAVERQVPVVLDADGLNAMPTILPTDGEKVAWDWSNLTLTPHPGEFARLCGTTAGDVQSRRRELLIAAARAVNARDDDAPDMRCVILLKGAGTLVCDGDRITENKTGNPGMATGGSGDVLTGVIAGLIAQGLAPFDAAILGAHIHGKAGDLAGAELTQQGMIATDILAALPRAIWETT
ncbi:MAG TPA: NAD(P)H-hydrate dehydratase [Phycisphaerae bacterium]|nr:NAD(P)H-hydrate dehydratase [Phycisphaerae bacterium]HRW52177.1 NAD(P)H-hydrate dehydratase [Phycisphaerae bacterium]